MGRKQAGIKTFQDISFLFPSIPFQALTDDFCDLSPRIGECESLRGKPTIDWFMHSPAFTWSWCLANPQVSFWRDAGTLTFKQCLSCTLTTMPLLM